MERATIGDAKEDCPAKCSEREKTCTQKKGSEGGGLNSNPKVQALGSPSSERSSSKPRV